MKNKKVCPKCGCKEIIFIPAMSGYQGGNFIDTGFTFMSSIPVLRYICSECGYSEEWIDKSDIKTLKKKFTIHE